MDATNRLPEGNNAPDALPSGPGANGPRATHAAGFPPPARLTLMVLVDALRPDYLTQAPYLRALATAGATGTLRECFGFVPRQAYFGGLTAEQYGFTNMYCWDPESSPFSVARGLPVAALERIPDEAAACRRWVEQTARERLTPFARLRFIKAMSTATFRPCDNPAWLPLLSCWPGVHSATSNELQKNGRYHLTR
jgi:hypothetical protein